MEHITVSYDKLNFPGFFSGFSIMKNKLFQSVRLTSATTNKNSQKEQLLEVQSLNRDVVTRTSLLCLSKTSGFVAKL